MIQGPNTRDARDKIAFFAFHAFHAFAVEVHANRAKIESGPNYMTAAHAFVIATLRLGLRAPLVARNKYSDHNIKAGKSSLDHVRAVKTKLDITIANNCS